MKPWHIQLAELWLLPRGWNGHKADTITDYAITTAKNILLDLRDPGEVKVAPRVTGGVRLCWSSAKGRVEVYIVGYPSPAYMPRMWTNMDPEAYEDNIPLALGRLRGWLDKL